jgi:hypothetical protein
LTSVPPSQSTAEDPVLVILQPEEEEFQNPELAWSVDVSGSLQDYPEESYRIYIDAENGAVLSEQDLILDFQTQGVQLKGRMRATATINGTCTIGPLDCTSFTDCWRWFPVENEAFFWMAHMQVVSAIGTVAVTALNGMFTIVSSTPTLQVTAQFLGPFVDVDNFPLFGPDLQKTGTLTNGVTTVISMNVSPPRVEEEVAQANAFYRINQTRDWVRGVNLNDAVMDSSSWTESKPYKAIVNRVSPSPCTADYTGTAVRFSHSFAGTPPTFHGHVECPPYWACPMTAYAPIIWHEMGHWLADRYGNGNGGRNIKFHGFGEGVADTFSLYQMDFHRLVYNSPKLPGLPATPQCPPTPNTAPSVDRCGENTDMFCGNCESQQGCLGIGDPHRNGQPLMGAFWKMRRMLKTNHPTFGAALSNALFLGWLNAYDTNRIHSMIEFQLLVLDDNDRNLGNGTPHQASIHPAFASAPHSFAPSFNATVFSSTSLELQDVVICQ